MNPWNLTEREAAIMDAVCMLGEDKLIVVRIGGSLPALRQAVSRSIRKIAAPNRTVAAVQWTKWRNGWGS